MLVGPESITGGPSGCVPAFASGSARSGAKHRSLVHPTCLDLEDDQRISVPCDDVGLSPRRPHSAAKELPPLSLQQVSRMGLPEQAEAAPVEREQAQERTGCSQPRQQSSGAGSQVMGQEGGERSPTPFGEPV